MSNSATGIILMDEETVPSEGSGQESPQSDSFKFLPASRLGSWECDETDNSDSDLSCVSDDKTDEEMLDCDWFIYPIVLDQADDVCIKLSNLIERFDSKRQDNV